MLKSIERSLKAEVNKYLDSDTVPSMTEHEMLSPVSEYCDEDRLKTERAELFLRYPVILCHIDEIPEPNCYFAEELSGIPVLAIRQKDGGVKVFLNVCRHRGVNVIENGSGRQPRFVCRFHGWSYAPDGSLSGVPFKEGFSGVDRACLGLTELPSEVRHGMVWTILTPGLDLDIASYLGALDAEINGYDIQKLVPLQRHFLEDDLNWKLAIDGFLETYHVQSLHIETIDWIVKTNFGLFKAYDKHGRMLTVRKKIEKVRHQPVEDWSLLRYAGVIYYLFPNTLLMWQGDRLTYWTCYSSDDPARSVSRVSVMVPAESAENLEKWAGHWDLVKRTVVDEDFVMARASQKSFRSGAQTHLVFGRNEPALQHFHRQLAEAIGPAK